MSASLKTCVRLLALAVVALALPALMGCDYGNNDDNNHKPPAGQGSLIIYDNTPDDIHVFIDGVSVEDVKDNDNHAYDLAPGVHRVVFDQRGGDRAFSDDVDILQDRRTIMDVANDANDSFEYDVAIFFD